MNQVISFGYFLLFQEYFCQTRGQCGVIRLLLKLRLVEGNSPILITVQEGIFSLRGFVGANDIAVRPRRRDAPTTNHKQN